jgi:uncharacterized protein
VKPRISVITLGVSDLERSLRFYRDGLGWPTEGIVGTQFERGAVAFFDLPSGLKLALWPRENIAWDARVPEARPAPPSLPSATLWAAKPRLTRCWSRRGRPGPT